MKDVYQISDLSSRDTLDQGADKPARLAVIGYPVAHSASPAMHQAALDALGVDARYIRLEVEPGQVAERDCKSLAPPQSNLRRWRDSRHR